MPIHHPDDGLLIEYAAGSLGEAKALLVATHLALCPACRAAVAQGEAIGGALLQDSAYRVGAGDPQAPEMTPEAESATAHVSLASSSIPSPLRDYLGGPIADLRWVPVWRGMSEYVLPRFAGSVRLLSIPGGRRMPRHTHGGEELTLVLQGSFADLAEHFGRGDVATADSSVDHQPTAAPDQVCLCLAVEDGPLRLTGWTGRLLTTAAALRAMTSRK